MHFLRTLSLALFAILIFTSEKCEKDNYQFTETTEVEIRTTACFGQCPVFTMKINGLGGASYNGKMFVKKEGRYTKRFSPGETNALLRSFDKADFFSFKNEYTGNVTDLPTTFLIFKKDGKEKKIKMYYNYPDKLKELEGYMKTAADTDGWEKVD